MCLDHFLQPLVTYILTYIKDSGHLLELLHKYKCEEKYVWVSQDVASLYTSIPHEASLKALEHFLSDSDSLLPSQITFLLKLAEFALTHNYFQFLDTYYLQITGPEMGASFAPRYVTCLWGSGSNPASGITILLPNI